jgi:hypothetical protein
LATLTRLMRAMPRIVLSMSSEVTVTLLRAAYSDSSCSSTMRSTSWL